VTEEVSSATCTVCACLCDDLLITHRSGTILKAERACSLAEPWYLRQGMVRPSVAEIEGRAVPLSEAIQRAGTILDCSKSPLIYGLSRSSTEGRSIRPLRLATAPR
jgi:formylmethanofuran dehydrogenase subunit B